MSSVSVVYVLTWYELLWHSISSEQRAVGPPFLHPRIPSKRVRARSPKRLTGNDAGDPTEGSRAKGSIQVKI